MKIAVKYVEVSVFELAEGDTRFKCSHELAEVEPPCCSGRDCGCYGNYSVYCSDCHNEDLTDSEVEAIVEAYIGNSEPDPDAAYEEMRDRELEACNV